jgi:hypothetical protein
MKASPIKYVQVSIPVKGRADLDSGDLAALQHYIMRSLAEYGWRPQTAQERKVLAAVYTEPF